MTPGNTYIFLPGHHAITVVLGTHGGGGEPAGPSVALSGTHLERCYFPLEDTEKPSATEFLLPSGMGLVNKFRSAIENKMMVILGA